MYVRYRTVLGDGCRNAELEGDGLRADVGVHEQQPERVRTNDRARRFEGPRFQG